MAGYGATGAAHKNGISEDAYALWDNPNLAAAVVCDGVGSYGDADKASKLVATTYAGGVRDLSRQALSPLEVSAQAMDKAYHALTHEKRTGRINRAAASTVVANLVDLKTGTMRLQWAGDSLGKKFSPETPQNPLRTLTKAHEAEDGIKLAKSFSGQGGKPNWEGRTLRRTTETPDFLRIILGSDGADRMKQRRDVRGKPDVLNGRIMDALSLKNAPTPFEAAYNLVEINKADTKVPGWADDTTVVVMDIYKK